MINFSISYRIFIFICIILLLVLNYISKNQLLYIDLKVLKQRLRVKFCNIIFTIRYFKQLIIYIIKDLIRKYRNKHKKD